MSTNNTTNRQGRPKAVRAQRTQRSASVITPRTGVPPTGGNQQIAYTQPFQSGAQPMDNVMFLDNSVLMPVDVQQQGQHAQRQQNQQPQYLNLDRSFVRPTTTPRNNVQILQNIAIRPPAGVARTTQQSVINRANAQHQVFTSNSSNSMFVPAPSMAMNQMGQMTQMSQLTQMSSMSPMGPMNPNRLRAVQPSMLPPGGTFVALDRNSGQEISQVSMQRPPPHMPVMHDTRPGAFKPAASKGAKSLLAMHDYPPYKMKMYGFSNAAKNTMFQMAPYFQKIYNPIFASSSQTLFLSVNYAQTMCIEVESAIMGEFITRLIPRLLETCSHPFVIELKEAASNWEQNIQKTFVIGKNNFEYEARRISIALKTRETILKEDAKLPELLSLEVQTRRSYLCIKIGLGNRSPDAIFADLTKRVKQNIKAKEDYSMSKMSDAEAQTEGTLLLPSNLMDLHRLQLNVTTNSKNRYDALIVLEEDHKQRMLMRQDQQDEQVETLRACVADLVEQQRKRSSARTKSEDGEAENDVKPKVLGETNTDYIPRIETFGSLPMQGVEVPITDQYVALVSDLIILHLKHMKGVIANQLRLKARIAKLRVDINRKRRGGGSAGTGAGEYSDVDMKVEDGSDEYFIEDLGVLDAHYSALVSDTPGATLVKSEERPTKERKAIGAMLKGCMNKFKEILSECKMIPDHLQMSDDLLPSIEGVIKQTEDDLLKEIYGGNGNEVYLPLDDLDLGGAGSAGRQEGGVGVQVIEEPSVWNNAADWF